jgi:hypothetical protein
MNMLLKLKRGHSCSLAGNILRTYMLVRRPSNSKQDKGNISFSAKKPIAQGLDN